MASRFAETVLERNPFAIDMFNFIWRVLNHAQGHIPNHVESYFNDDIGFSVLYIQFIIRDSLREIFKGIRIRTTEDAINVTRKLCRVRRSNDKMSPVIFQVFLYSCAIITEVYLYCSRGIQIPIESSMVFISWNFVFSRRRIRELLSSGGWEELTTYARNKYHGKINFINYELDYLDYPHESFITNQTYDSLMAADFNEYFVKEFKVILQNPELIDKNLRNVYRQQKSALRVKRVEERLIAKQKMGTPDAENILASQSRMAMRSGRRSNEVLKWEKDLSPYVTSDEDCNEDTSPSVFELCTKMSNVQIAGESKRKRPKRKKKPSHKSSSVGEEGSESSSTFPIESVSSEKGSVSMTLTSSSPSRPLEVPARSPQTSPTKSETKVISPKQSQTGKKGKKE